MSNELLPILSGLTLGAVLGKVHPKYQAKFGIIFAALLGGAATVASGEYRLSWFFLVVDTALVTLAAAASLFSMPRLSWGARKRIGVTH